MVGEAPAHNEATGRGLYASLTRWRSRRSGLRRALNHLPRSLFAEALRKSEARTGAPNLYAIWYCAIAITARVSVLLGCRSSSRIVK
jgi:hypothetical protein